MSIDFINIMEDDLNAKYLDFVRTKSPHVIRLCITHADFHHCSLSKQKYIEVQGAVLWGMERNKTLLEITGGQRDVEVRYKFDLAGFTFERKYETACTCLDLMRGMCDLAGCELRLFFWKNTVHVSSGKTYIRQSKTHILFKTWV